ncbi:MAG: HAD family hydrolase [Marinoscillum sp.]|uniref:HAD family hydrolase n=1 Tax=Marinoscillum sp. TaxID=2024838 RepID=UPI0032F7971E
MISALFLDLDDTIFPTRSIPDHISRPFFQAIRASNKHLTDADLNNAEQAMWNSPIHLVFQQYHFTEEMISGALSALEVANLTGLIKPYPDYNLVRNLPCEKFLITSGFTQFQKKKIRALNISSHFREIMIDDPLLGGKGKRDAFDRLIEKYQIQKKEILVIGDNPSSEIEAGNQLGLTTILIDRRNTPPGEGLAHYTFPTLSAMIDAFPDLRTPNTEASSQSAG